MKDDVRGMMDELIDGKQQRCLRQLTLMITVFAVTDGANGQDDTNIGIHLA